MGKTIADLGMPIELVTLWHEAIEKIFKNKTREEIEFEFSSGGESRFFHMIGNPEFDQKGEVNSVFVNTRDLTEKRNLQQKMIHAVRSSSFQSVTQEFTHHLNNPLSVALARIEMMQVHEGFQSISGVQQHFESLKNEIFRMKDLVTNMNRITSFRPETDFPNYSMKASEAIDSAIQMCGKLRLSDGVKLHMDYFEDFILESGFGEIMEMIFEVLKNALESARLNRNPEIWIETRYASPNFEVNIFDIGSEIPNEILEKIWLPFFSTKGPSYRG